MRNLESFAFWYKKNKGKLDKELSAVMNFNLWSECGWKKDHSRENEKPYLDIGFKVKNLDLAEQLYFFVPMKIQLNQIEDLGCKFNKTELVDAVFNERYETTIAANTKTIYVQSSNEPDDKFYIYQLDKTHDIQLEGFADGTILSIQTQNILNGPKAQKQNNEEPITTYYFRFRIKDDDLSFLIHSYSTPHSALQNLFRETYMIDFRYHNVRSLDKTLVEKFHEQSNAIVNVTAVHFLLITKAYVDVSSNEFSGGARTIENDIWVDYVDKSDSKDTTDLVAYHYVKKKNKQTQDDKDKFVESSELFSKFSVERSVIGKYIVFTVLVGAIGSNLVPALVFICKFFVFIWKLL